ncbi:hypothetical protein ACFVAJ_16475 [Agromyces sp. NPDC057679]|uniref:hypothetical protein n=1 Tax=Agromyces sp. NPDC057679 TaxID=3346207 RepID=UPI00366C54A4
MISKSQAEDAVGSASVELAIHLTKNTDIRPGLVNTLANAAFVQQFQQDARHETHKGLKLTRERIAKIEAEEQRIVSEREAIAISEEIRVSDAFHPNHRPPVGYLNHPTVIGTIPLDELDKNSRRSVEVGESRHSTPQYEGSGSARDRLADSVDSKQLSKKNAKAELWDAYAADLDLPKPAARQIKPKEADVVRKYLADTPGRILDACNDHLEGRNTKRLYALLAPFGPISNTEKAELVEFLLDRPAYAQQLWESALEQSVARQPRRAR